MGWARTHTHRNTHLWRTNRYECNIIISRCDRWKISRDTESAHHHWNRRSKFWRECRGRQCETDNDGIYESSGATTQGLNRVISNNAFRYSAYRFVIDIVFTHQTKPKTPDDNQKGGLKCSTRTPPTIFGRHPEIFTNSKDYHEFAKFSKQGLLSVIDLFVLGLHKCKCSSLNEEFMVTDNGCGCRMLWLLGSAFTDIRWRKCVVRSPFSSTTETAKLKSWPTVAKLCWNGAG